MATKIYSSHLKETIKLYIEEYYRILALALFILFYSYFYFILFLFLFLFLFLLRAGSPQQREPITVGPYYLIHPVNWRRPEYSEQTHDFQQSVDYTLFTPGLGSSPH